MNDRAAIHRQARREAAFGRQASPFGKSAGEDLLAQPFFDLAVNRHDARAVDLEREIGPSISQHYQAIWTLGPAIPSRPLR
jgi:hypothetical protein